MSHTPDPLPYQSLGIAPAAAQNVPEEPSPAPREVTPTILRRAWAEKHVRIWWLMGAAILAVAVYYAASRLYSWYQESQLIKTGVKVQATVMHWEPAGKSLPGKLIQPGSMVQLEYTHQGGKRNVFGHLAGRTTELKTGDVVPLVIDPSDPERWTGRTEPASLLQELLTVMILLPMSAVLFLIAVYARRQVVRVYRDGSPVLSEVIGVGHSAAAPFSRLVRCAVHIGGNDARVIKVLLPSAKAPPVGAPLWLITPENRPEQGIPAALFE